MIKYNDVTVNIEIFPNGESRITIPNISPYRQDIELIYESDADLIHLMMVKKHLENNLYGNLKKSNNFNLTMKYVPYSRMDRVKNSGFVFTLKYAMEFINSLGFDQVTILEPHSDVAPALINNVFVSTPIKKLFNIACLEQGFDLDKDYIYFPDATAKKRQEDNFMKNYENILYGIKHRDFKTGDITGLEIQGNFKNIKPDSKVFMIDDLTSYGGTFVFGDIELKKLGFDKSFLIVAHAERSCFEKKLFDHIEKLYTTNSIIQEEDIPEELKERVKILDR